ncbi:hypothetical protein NSQ59_07295 [Margalitia sp. FSL K6-0131]
MKIVVIDKSIGKIFWTEEHKTKEDALKAMQQMKENHFNPECFNYKLQA